MLKMQRLVLWDIDHTLLIAGELDHFLCRCVFRELVGAEMRSPFLRGTGLTVPAAVHMMFARTGLPDEQVNELTERALRALPKMFAAHRQRLLKEGRVLTGAREALHGVRGLDGTVANVLSGNLRTISLEKLDAFDLTQYIDTDVGPLARTTQTGRS
jgi:phosphoglycolate phosphatase